MEDVVTESEWMLPPVNLTAEDAYEEEERSGFSSNRRIVEEEEEEEETKGGGGLITNLISSVASPLSLRTGEAKTEDENRNGVSKKKEEEDGGHGGEEEGGIISNIISNFFHQREAEGTAENEDEEKNKKREGDIENQQVKTEDGNCRSGGIVGNFVSHLPASIPDEAVPTADEATILINALIRD